MRCPKCGSNNESNELFCKKCGSELKTVRSTDSKVFNCPYCDAENPQGDTECHSCHKPIRSPFVYCEACGRKNLSSDRLCRECDAPLPVKGASEPQPVVSVALETLHCPACGKPMARGFLVFPNEGYFRGLRWSDSEAYFWPYAGEPLQRGSLFVSNTNTNAFRCVSCRIVVMSY